MGAINDLKSWSKQQGAPVTLGIVFSVVASALILWFTRAKGMESLRLSSLSNEQPWTFFTYPWSQMPFADGLSLMFFVFLMMWLFSFGAPVERMMGSRRYAIFCAASIVGTGLVAWLGMLVLGINRPIGDAYLLASAITMVWCARNMTQVVMLNGFIPLSGKWLAVVDTVVLVLLYGFPVPLFGVICALPLVFVFLYASGRIPWLSIEPQRREVHATRAQARYKESYYDDVRKREQERDERERLRKLFESSLDEDK
jgi:membrane associated rhomboid family serine protease